MLSQTCRHTQLRKEIEGNHEKDEDDADPLWNGLHPSRESKNKYYNENDKTDDCANSDGHLDSDCEF